MHRFQPAPPTLPSSPGEIGAILLNRNCAGKSRGRRSVCCKHFMSTWPKAKVLNTDGDEQVLEEVAVGDE